MSLVEKWMTGSFMIRVDPYFLYQVGAAIRPLIGVSANWTKAQITSKLWAAEDWLDALINRSVYSLQTSHASGIELLGTVKRILKKYSIEDDAQSIEDEVDYVDAYLLQSQAQKFENVLAAELQWGQLYLVEPKGGYDLNQLTSNGLAIFPPSLSEKVPEAIQDAIEAARCIAFALPTAAAFHLHRVNELVLRSYYDTVTGGAPRPVNRNIGAYIDAMKNAQFKDQKIFGALAALKDFHRNPVLHPDHHIETVEEAIALLGVVNTVITYMLGTIRPAPLELTSPLGNEQEAIEHKA